MKRPTFLEGVGVALVACVIGGVLYAVLPPVFGWESPLRALIAGLGLAYIVYLLNRSQTRVGKVTVVSVWLAGAVALWLVHPPFTLTLDDFEVAEAFEVPLSFFLTPGNKLRHSRVFLGKERPFYAYPYGDYYIWGATAGMLVNLAEALAEP